MSENSSKLDRKLTEEILVELAFWSQSEVPDTELKKKKKELKQTPPWLVGLNCLGKHFAGEPPKGSSGHISISA